MKPRGRLAFRTEVKCKSWSLEPLRQSQSGFFFEVSGLASQLVLFKYIYLHTHTNVGATFFLVEETMSPLNLVGLTLK